MNSRITCCITLLCLMLAPAQLIAQECRTQCGAREIIDAYGCCAPLELDSSKTSSRPPDDTPPVILSPGEFTRPAIRLRAYHVTAPREHTAPRMQLVDEIIKGTKQLKSSKSLDAFDAIMLRDSLGNKAWEVWLSLETELLRTEQECAEEQDDTQRERCAAQLTTLLAARRDWLQIASGIWQPMQGPLHYAAHLDEPIVSAIRAQAMYYQAAAELATGDAELGFGLVKTLITFDEKSPYAALAAMSMADFFLETGSPELAATFYLKASQHPHNISTAYAFYRHAWCLVAQKEWEQSMRMLIHALEATQHTERLVPGTPLLVKEITQDIISIYAQTGLAKDSPLFFSALGVPDGIIPIYLRRLRKGYEKHSRDDQIEVIDALLERAQDLSSGEGTSMPRSR